ncbi:lactate utilization protein [Paenibacillus aurantius]|uniref:Lactate utilization protein n=1 Tax=Paenibacillus aurantius TaxID=2918900 RepID=A0AA96LHH0_9BACL|nr:lactate utilization protein [Paenibacillus aurantius]WNQ13395.1 lactate utilization protein [Paenibacillus aurantius]
MANPNPFLAGLEEKSRERQKEFISHIAGRLGRKPLAEKPQHPFKGAPSFWHGFELSEEERIALFMENWRKAGGHAFRLPDGEAVQQFIVERVEETKARHLIRQDQEELENLGLEEALPDVEWTVWGREPKEQLLPMAAGADIGLVAVDFAAAYTGSLVVTSSAQKGRSVSLLPTIMIAIIPVSRLRTRLGQVLAEFDGKPREQFPAGIHFISGPSRSADIENDLTIGVHGPGIVYALLVG